MRAGFSLIEVVIVLALLGITATLAAPALRSALADDDTHATIRAARSLLEGARSAALERGTRVDVVVDSADGRYWVLITGDSIRSGRLESGNGAHLEVPRARAHFVWDARAAAVADTLVFVTNAGRVGLTLEPWSGRVVVDAR